MPSSIALIPSGDTTGATDTAAVNTALGNAGAGGSVLLGPGNWYTHAPLAVPPGVELAGIKGAINGPTARAPAGSVIHPVAAFSGSGVISLSAVAGVRISLQGVAGTPAYAGATDLHPRLVQLREARQTGSFEGVVSWGLGLAGNGCLRVLAPTAASPTLVVDIVTR